MAQGPSGRIVIEVDPTLKRELYSKLAAEGICLKEWFIRHATDYMAEREQPSLPGLGSARGQRRAVFVAQQEGPDKTHEEGQR
jgi:hypothetical protein